MPLACKNPPTALTVTSTGSAVADSCLDEVDGKTVLKLRGTKNFPLLVSWSGDADKGDGGYFGFDVTGVTQWLTDKLQHSATNSVAIRAGGDLSLNVNPDSNGPVLVSATYDPQLQLIGILDALTRVITALRSALGLDKAADDVFAAVTASGCLADDAKELDKSPAQATFKIVTDCLGSVIKTAAKSSPNLLLHLLGSVPAVLGSLLAVVAYAGSTSMRPFLIAQDVFTGKTSQSWTIRSPDSPTSAPTAGNGNALWPTQDNEGPTTLFAWLGANMMGFPSFSSCDKADSYCIVGLDNTVDIIDIKALQEVGSVPMAVADPAKALEQQGLTAAEVAQLLLAGPAR